MTKEELKIIQNYPLEIKVAKTKQRIREYVNYYGLENVYISFSGGKDSTVLLDIARQVYPEIKAVFCDTGLEYPEIKEFVKSVDNIEIIRPKKSFRDVIRQYGYPIVSKETSQMIDEIRNTRSQKLLHKRLYGDEKGRFKLPAKWRFLITAPFKISHKCCYHLKKSPLNSYHTKTKRVPIIGTLAEESSLRISAYLKHGCNTFNSNHPKSQPLSFWKQQDILEYIVQNNLRIAPCYGEVKRNENGHLYTEGVDRTGCIFCAFGCQFEKSPNKYQRLKETHPKLYEYCINGGEFDETGNWQPSKEGLGFWKVLDYINIDYK